MSAAPYIARHILPAAAALLPSVMDSPEASALLMAIGRQESKFQARRQLPNGPARGFWQFELGGVEGVLEHPSSHASAVRVMEALGYPLASARDVHLAIEHNDVLAACFARLLLWTDPRALPSEDNPTQGWLIYLATWRPGRPHASTWAAHFDAAWTTTERTA
jgi:hypothetical protein